MNDVVKSLLNLARVDRLSRMEIIYMKSIIVTSPFTYSCLLVFSFFLNLDFPSRLLLSLSLSTLLVFLSFILTEVIQYYCSKDYLRNVYAFSFSPFVVFLSFLYRIVFDYEIKPSFSLLIMPYIISFICLFVYSIMRQHERKLRYKDIIDIRNRRSMIR